MGSARQVWVASAGRPKTTQKMRGSTQRVGQTQGPGVDNPKRPAGPVFDPRVMTRGSPIPTDVEESRSQICTSWTLESDRFSAVGLRARVFLTSARGAFYVSERYSSPVYEGEGPKVDTGAGGASPPPAPRLLRRAMEYYFFSPPQKSGGCWGGEAPTAHPSDGSFRRKEKAYA